MKILTENKTSIIAPVELESTDEVGYAGHYTVDGLEQLVSKLKKRYEPHRVIALAPVCRGDYYTLVAILDEGKGIDEPNHLALAGCKCGRDGTE
jgi:hypothetical protein